MGISSGRELEFCPFHNIRFDSCGTCRICDFLGLRERQALVKLIIDSKIEKALDEAWEKNGDRISRGD